MDSKATDSIVTAIGIDIGKNTFHLVGLDERGSIVLRRKFSRGQVAARLANMKPCLVGMEACVGAHHLSRQLLALGHEVKLVPAQFVKPFLKGQKNDFRDAEAVAEAVQRPTMRFVPTKSVDQLDLQALHRVRSRLVSQRTAIVNQIRAFLLERGIAVRQGLRFLRHALPDILANRADALTPRMVNMIKDLAGDWHHLDQRIDEVTGEIETLARDDEACQRLMTVPGIGPIIASAMVATIGDGSALPPRTRLRRLARARAATDLDRRSNHPWPHLQAREQLSSHALRAGGSGRAVTAGQLAQAQLWPVVGSCRQAHASQRRRDRTRQQADPNRLECALPRSRLRASNEC